MKINQHCLTIVLNAENGIFAFCLHLITSFAPVHIAGVKLKRGAIASDSNIYLSLRYAIALIHVIARVKKIIIKHAENVIRLV